MKFFKRFKSNNPEENTSENAEEQAVVEEVVTVESASETVEANYQGEEIYEIDPKRCTECVGHFDVPQCQQVCPVDCIPLDELYIETEEELMEKYHQLENES